MQDGKKFEELTFSIFEKLSANRDYEKVEQNVMLDGFDGKRQIDVLITGSVGPFSVRTMVECKDYNRKVNILVIDEVASKMQDVDAHKAVVVSRKGFTRTASRKARRLGISLCTAHAVNSEKWKFDLEYPLIVKEIKAENYTVSFDFIAVQNQTGIGMTSISGIPLAKIIADYWNATNLDAPDGESKNVFSPKIPKPWVELPDGRNLSIQNIKIEMNVTVQYYFGYFNDFESSKLLKFIDEGSTQVIFNPQELGEYRTKFVRYNTREDIPAPDSSAFFIVKHIHDGNAKPKDDIKGILFK